MLHCRTAYVCEMCCGVLVSLTKREAVLAHTPARVNGALCKATHEVWDTKMKLTVHKASRKTIQMTSRDKVQLSWV